MDLNIFGIEAFVSARTDLDSYSCSMTDYPDSLYFWSCSINLFLMVLDPADSLADPEVEVKIFNYWNSDIFKA